MSHRNRNVLFSPISIDQDNNRFFLFEWKKSTHTKNEQKTFFSTRTAEKNSRKLLRIQNTFFFSLFFFLIKFNFQFNNKLNFFTMQMKPIKFSQSNNFLSSLLIAFSDDQKTPPKYLIMHVY